MLEETFPQCDVEIIPSPSVNRQRNWSFPIFPSPKPTTYDFSLLVNRQGAVIAILRVSG